jgi:hypothetical protein
MNYWCNCPQSFIDKGVYICSTSKKQGIHYVFQRVDVRNGDICIHCDHTAFFSKTNPNLHTQEEAHG